MFFGHNMLMAGVPGSGKTLLARVLPGILPEMSIEESLDVTRIASSFSSTGYPFTPFLPDIKAPPVFSFSQEGFLFVSAFQGQFTPRSSYFTVYQAAQVCQVTSKQIRAWIRKGKLEAIDLPGLGILIEAGKLNEFLSSQGE
jgi:excisionase family DNA binding protein